MTEPIILKIDDSVHPEGCRCSIIEVLKVDKDSIIVKYHDVSPCTLPLEDRYVD